MMRVFTSLAIAGVIVGIAGALFAQNAATPSTPAPGVAPPQTPPALNYTVKDIDGKDVNLAAYQGKVIMMLNVASRCGNTKQYTALENLYKKYKDKGLVIIGFPANNFGGQEPGTNQEIKEFCTAEDSKYKITFPLMSKVSVKGDDIHPLFKYLTTQESKPLSKGDIRWNFEKFLIGRDGTLVNRFTDKTTPDDAKIVEAIEAALAK